MDHETRDVKPSLIVITGPTGVGKTDLSIRLAEAYNGEIISADSMQIYRYMDIGTAKPSPEERLRVSHHLIDVVNPDEEFNASMFVKKADEVIAHLHSMQKAVFVVGGTGLYLEALLGGLLNAPGADKSLRDSYRRDAAHYGKEYLYRQLKDIDATAAERIHPNDLVRTIRALEVLEHTGQSITERQGEHRFSKSTYDVVKICLTVDRSILYERINDRVEVMMEAGLVEEVKTLMSRGYNESHRPMQSMTYRNVVSFIRGEQSEQDMIRLIKRDTRRYARRQLTWFKRDSDIKWFAPQDENMIRGIIENSA